MDDLGYQDVGCYWTPSQEEGFEKIETPHIDRLAAEGARFTSFLVADSICTPSRAALLTGCYPARVGMSFPPDHHGVLRAQTTEGLNPDEITVAELLNERGYATLCVGKWHLGNRLDFLLTQQGFDEAYGPASRGKNKPVQLLRGEEPAEIVEHEEITAVYTREAIRFIEDHRDEPFFVFLSHGMPHVPLGVRDSFRGRSARGLYGDVVMELDWSTGEILAALSRLELDDETLVIFTSDNDPALALGPEGGKAFPLRRGKSTAYEGGFRVPFLARWPGKIPAGLEVGELVTALDLLPTFCGLAGTRPPADRTIDGHDAWNLFVGTEAARSPYEMFAYYRRARLEALRSGPWKLHFDASGEPAALFNLEEDVSESADRSAQRPEVVARLAVLAEPVREDLGDVSRRMRGRGTRPLGHSESPSVKQ